MLRSLFALAAVAALLATGCGSNSDGGGSGGGGKSTSKPPLIARADAICKPLNARRKADNAKVGAVTSVATLPKVAQVAPGLVAYERKAVAELRRLTAPASLAAPWRKILAGTQKLVDNTAKLGEDAQAGNLQGVKDVIHKSQETERALIVTAKTAGFAHCGRNT
jgi:hypothetical protein